METGGTGPVPIHTRHLFGGTGGFGSPFLHGSGIGSTPHGASSTAGTGRDILVSAGTDYVQNFSLTSGDKLDLSQILAGAPLTHDLTNIGDFVKVLGTGQNDPGYGAGTKTSLEVIGPDGTAIVNLEGSGKLDLKDLLTHNSLILPPH